MSKKVRLSYSSSLNITFHGEDEWDAPEDWDEMTEDHRLRFLASEEEEWLWSNVEVFAEVVDGLDNEG